MMLRELVFCDIGKELSLWSTIWLGHCRCLVLSRGVGRQHNENSGWQKALVQFSACIVLLGVCLHWPRQYDCVVQTLVIWEKLEQQWCGPSMRLRHCQSSIEVVGLRKRYLSWVLLGESEMLPCNQGVHHVALCGLKNKHVTQALDISPSEGGYNWLCKYGSLVSDEFCILSLLMVRLYLPISVRDIGNGIFAFVLVWRTWWPTHLCLSN